MKQIISAVPRNVKIVRLKEVERNPDMFIQVSTILCNHVIFLLQEIEF